MEETIYFMEYKCELIEYPGGGATNVALVSAKSPKKAESLLEKYLRKNLGNVYTYKDTTFKDTNFKSDKEGIIYIKLTGDQHIPERINPKI